jgi:hypothetical protein
MNLLNLISMMYYGTTHPFLRKTENRLQILNELSFQMITIILMALTEDFIPSEEMKFKCGWYYIGVVCLTTAANFLVLWYI